MIHILAALATWRLTAFLVYDGTTQKLRDRAYVGMETDDGRPINLGAAIFGCFWCCSIPIALLVTIAVIVVDPTLSVMEAILYPWALSGAAVLLNHNARIHLTME